MVNLNKNKSFCVLPFIHILGVGNRVKPCCRFEPSDSLIKIFRDKHEGGESIGEIFYSKEYDELREKMLLGEKIPGCHKCYKEEERGGNSIRLGAYADYKHIIPPDNMSVIKYLEIGFGNICNLRCRTCASALSSNWLKEDTVLPKKYKRNQVAKHELLQNKIADSDLSNLEYIKITGGEPILSAEFEPFIDRIIKMSVNKNISLHLFTNSSYFPSDRIVNKLLQFKALKLHLSIDACGNKNDYIRNPSVWSRVDETAQKWVEIGNRNKNVLVALESTISLYNSIYLEELFDWWIKINNNHISMHLIFLQSPSYLSIMNVSFELKKYFKNEYERLYSKYKNIKSISTWLRNISKILDSDGKNEIEQFIGFTKELDSSRRESFYETFPDLDKLIKKFR